MDIHCTDKEIDDDAYRAKDDHDDQRQNRAAKGCVVFHLLASPEHQHEDQEDDRQRSYRDA
jgi:hypothetical protein